MSTVDGTVSNLHIFIGTWGAFEYGFMRKIPATMFAALVTAPISVPLETARMAYYADKTFPKEL